MMPFFPIETHPAVGFIWLS